MKMSQLYSPTLREAPAEAELASHKLMLRAGLMRRSTTGVYSYLPLGYRVLRKVMEIIREEMDRADGQEILLPILQPAELWIESGRWDDYGDEMFRVQDRNKRQFCLGPTHEEIVTALVRADVRSYRQLPIRLYQIQNKYRDEIRPRFGVIRGREFIMKDCYSFDRDEEGLSVSYKAMYDAYSSIFARCGLDAKPVEADSGAIGGDATHEFMVLSDTGEALIIHCPKCGYAANVEKAECLPPTLPTAGNLAPIQEISTPNVTTIEDVAAFLDVPATQLVKTMIYMADEKPIAALVRGDHTLNEVKLQKILGCDTLNLATPEQIFQVTGAPLGFAGPIGLSVPLIVDHSVTKLENAVVGGNKQDVHLINVNLGRDYQATYLVDIRNAEAGDPCPHCDGRVQEVRGTEVGQVFKLGTKYSEPLKATFVDENGQEKPLVMGCYGIGVSRTVAAIIDQHSDEDGICWPLSVAPYSVIVVPVSFNDEAQKQAACEIYQKLQNLGIEVVLDDRLERPGVKFKDADLIGFPLRITIGPKALQDGNVEITVRSTKETRVIPLANIENEITSLLKG